MASVLVVDGNLAEWDWYRLALRDITVRVVRTLDDAMATARDWRPDVIVLSSLLGGRSSLGEIVRLGGASDRSRIVVAAADYSESEGHRALDAGATFYASKNDARLLRATVLAACALADPLLRAGGG